MRRKDGSRRDFRREEDRTIEAIDRKATMGSGSFDEFFPLPTGKSRSAKKRYLMKIEKIKCRLDVQGNAFHSALFDRLQELQTAFQQGRTS